MSAVETRTEPCRAPAMDFTSLLGRCLGNFQMVERVVAAFCASGPSDVARLQEAIERADFAAVVEIAHRFRGAAGNVSAVRLCDLLKRVERLGREQRRPELLMIMSQLPAEWEALERQCETIAPAAGRSVGGPAWARSLEPCHAGARC